MRNFLESRTPFSDYDYIDFILNIPPEFKFNKKLYKKMILTAFPTLRDIPYGATGSPLYRFHLQFKIMKLTKLAVNKMTKKFFKHEFFSNREKSLDDYGTWIRTNNKLREYILDILLDQKTLERPYFNQKYIKEIIESHMKGEKDYSRLIGLLVTFELWNRKFMDLN